MSDRSENPPAIGASAPAKMPSVFDYLNYRNFIRDRVEFMRARNEYSNRKFAAEVGFGSPSYLRMVIGGQRHLSRENSEKLSKAFGLDEKEAEFFELLVEFDQASDLKAQDLAYKKILGNEVFRKVRKMAQAEYEFFSNWQVVAIFEGLSTDFGQLPASRMAEMLEISVQDLEHHLSVLKRLGLIDFTNGRWVKKDRQLETPLDIQSLNVRNFHRQMGLKAMDVIDRLASTERTFAGMTINLSEQGYQDFRKRIFDFLRDSNAVYSESEKSDTVFQLNIQLFPLLRLKPFGVSEDSQRPESSATEESRSDTKAPFDD